MVRKYHIADALTSSRFLFALAIVVMTIVGAPPVWVLIAFVIGELTDAADGPAAAKWPYPAELEQSLWWRIHKVGFDQAADMVLGFSALTYVALYTYPFGMVLLQIALTVGVILQLLVVLVLKPLAPKLAEWVILLRRSLLYVPAIGAVIIMLLLKTTVVGELTWGNVWQSESLKVCLTLGVLAGIVLAYLKRDRIVEVTRKTKRTVD